MDIKLELLSNCIATIVRENFDTLKINPDKIIETESIKILDKIKKVICDETLSDFEMIDKIVDIFGEHHIDCGSCHDF